MPPSSDDKPWGHRVKLQKRPQNIKSFLHFVTSTLRISSRINKHSTTVLTTSHIDEELFPQNIITLTIFLELKNVVICYKLPYYEHGSALTKHLVHRGCK
jgi:hypothetical protein